MMNRLLSALICVLIFNPCGQSAAQDRGFDALRARVMPLMDAHDGDVSLVVLHPESGEKLIHNAERVMPTASLIKVAVMVAAYRESDAGRLDLTTMIPLTEADRVPGSGILTEHFSNGLSLSVGDAIRLMMRYSDNTATNLVVNQIGLERIAEAMEELGFEQTRLHSLVYRGDTSIDPENSKLYGLGRTTASEMSRLLNLIRTDKAASAHSCEAMRKHLEANDDTSKLARAFPAGKAFAHKTGAVSASRTDAGFLTTDMGPVVICALTANNGDKSWKEGNAAEVLLGRIGQSVLESFAKPWDAAEETRPELRNGDFGEMVEALQRTLNSQLEPSPKLSIDGDFGPATQSAVVRFQEQSDLESDGIVDADVWKALGPLQFAGEPVANPGVVNATELPKKPADPDSGLPFVTCRAWSAVDLQTGRPIAGFNADSHLPMASTTKIMTAWLVLRLAENDPSILNETLTYSRRADRTRGSTSAIREGETLPVSDVLYGLLLPSGNDASVALAEQFGARAAAMLAIEIADDGDSDPLDTFVEAMNAEATRLKLEKTHFTNPHGLDSDNHYTSAFDLARLAITALSNDRLREIVNTRQYGCRVTGRGGYSRNVVWKNTNQLLATEGYRGVKTGTTTKAGACLVSVSDRDGELTVLATLGSASSPSRYTDARNLHRWVRRVRRGEEEASGQAP